METIAQEALTLLSAVPAERFQSDFFTDNVGKCCVIGHYNRLKSLDPNDYSQRLSDWTEHSPGNALRNASAVYLSKNLHFVNIDISSVNNSESINGYTEPEIKDRVIHLLEDMVKAGY